MGLFKAIHSYDLSKGATFASWSKFAILREVLTVVREIDHATMPQGAFDVRNKVRKTKEILEAQLGREPTIEELAKEAKASPAAVDAIINTVKLTSLHAATTEEEEDLRLENVIADERESIEDRVLYELELEALRTFGISVLTEQERIILVRISGLDGEPPMKLQDLGRYIGRCRESIRQDRNKAMAKLRHPSVLAKLYWASRVDTSQISI